MKRLFLFLFLAISALNAGDIFLSYGRSPTRSFGGPFDAAAYRMWGDTPPYIYFYGR